MKKIRAVVELSVPDGHNFTEADFAKSLRRQFGRSIFSLAPTYKESRPVQFKEFGRVVQYDQEGNRVAPPKLPSSFEKLVLFGLWLIAWTVIDSGRLSRAPRTIQWFDDVRNFLREEKPG